MTAEHIAERDIEADIRAGAAPAETVCAGAWTLRGIASLEKRLEAFSWPAAGELSIDCSGIAAMDTSGAWMLHRTVSALQGRGRSVRLYGLRAEFDALLKLIASRAAAPRPEAAPAPGMLEKFGRQRWIGFLDTLGMLAFLGEAAVVALRSLARPRRIRWRPVLHNLQIGGFEALPITGLLSFLLGIVIAYREPSSCAASAPTSTSPTW